jgi:hypothetical protein
MNTNGYIVNTAAGRRLVAYIVAAALALSVTLIYAGCSNSSADSEPDRTAADVAETEPSDEPTGAAAGLATGPAVSAAAVEAPATEPAYDIIIGDAGGAGQVAVTNGLGLDITSLSVRRTGGKKFGGVADAPEISWPAGGTALLHYVLPPAEASPSSTGGAVSPAATGGAVAGQEYLCDIRIGLSDGSKVVLHAADLGHDEIMVKSADGVSFITFDGADGAEVSTYEAEKALKEDKAAKKAEAKAEEKAKAEAAKEKKKVYKPTKSKKKKADDACVDDIVLR